MPGNASAGPLRARRSAELLAAARGGSWPQVGRLLQEGADANAQGAHKVTALMLAAKQGAVEAIGTLLAHRSDPNALDGQGGRSALLYACGSRSASGPAVARLLLEASADVRARDASGATPLTVAAEIGSVDLATVLLGMGADLFAVARAEEPSIERMGLASRRVYDTLVQGKRYDPVLNYAEHRRALDRADAERTLEEVGDDESQEAETVDMSGTVDMASTPTVLLGGLLQDSEGSSYESSEMHDHFQDYEGSQFLSRVAPLRPQDQAILTRPPPTGAARQGHDRKSQALRRVVHAFDGSHDTALVIAARGGHTDFCNLLLLHAADASAEDGKGESALEAAAHAGRYETCEALLASRPPAPRAHAKALAAAEAAGFQEVAMLLQGYKSHAPGQQS